MLLSKTVLAVIVAAAAGGIVIVQATTYVLVNQQASTCDDGFVPELTEEERKWVNTPTNVRVDNPNTLSSKTPIGLPKKQ